MKTKHTPGPWFLIKNPESQAQNGYIYAITRSTGDPDVDEECVGITARTRNLFTPDRTPAEVRANAALISAAPELLEALKEAVIHLNSRGGIQEWMDRVAPTVFLAKLAISKAEQEES